MSVHYQPQRDTVDIKYTLIICLGLLILWLALFYSGDWFAVMTEHYQISATMVFGSFVAGSTPLGGGAVAFPVLTKIMSVQPDLSRHFSLMIQSVGMTSASVVIVLSVRHLPWRLIGLYLTGACSGFLVAAVFLYPFLSDTDIRVTFSLSIGVFIAIYLIGYHFGRFKKKLLIISQQDVFPILIFGILGGGTSAFIGSGADLFAFALLTLYLRLNIILATQISVIIMAATSLYGSAILFLLSADVDPVVIEYWYAAAPVVIFGAPIGAWFCRVVDGKVIHQLILFLASTELLTTVVMLPITEVSIIIFLTQIAVMVSLFIVIRFQSTQNEYNG